MDPIVTGTTANLSSEAAKGIFKEAKRHVRYVRVYKRNVDKFEEKLKILMAKRAGLQQEVDTAKRNVEKIKADVEDWCNRVDRKIEEEGKKVKELEDKAKNKCFIGLCPNIKCRYQLSRKAEEGANAVDELLQQGQFDGVSYRDVPEDSVDDPPKDFEAFESRDKVFNDIMEALKDSTIRMMGVYGMAGVGKTTLVNEVARQVKKAKLFDAVVTGVINQTPDIWEIQNQIADPLGLKFEEQSVIGRASRLCERLKKEKILVVLDDLWARLDLKEVGIPLNDPEKRTEVEIPFGDENKGCHVLLTSRNRNVLTNEMDARKIFQIGVLEEKESWELFKKMAGDTAESPKLRSTAIEVAKECAGLPLAIATVARALRNEDIYVWKDALRQLQRPSSRNFRGVPKEVYLAIELSYNHLENDELKHTFRICSLIGRYASVEFLFRFSMGLGLFHDCNTVEEKRNRWLTLVKSLKDSCLLNDSYNKLFVVVNDLVYDVALAIASSDNNVFLLKPGDVLTDWPDGYTMEKCTTIGLHFANISYFPKELKCPQLSFLSVLARKDSSIEVPASFFKETKNLRVLNLLNLHFASLPSSISLLSNLRTLFLDQCMLGDIALIGELKNLESLAILRCDIEMLPKEIGQLSELKLLDLRGCTKLKIIPPGVLSSLFRLEELYLRNSFVQWEVERHANQQTNATLAELKLLSRLTTLDIHIPDANLMPEDFFFEKLERYKIFIGKAWDWPGVYEYSRTLKLELDRSSDHLDDGIKMLLKRTEDLHLDGMKGAEVALHGLINEQGCQQLKNLRIQNCLDTQYMVDDNGVGNENEFCHLRSLTLQSLPQLISFSSENRRNSTFGSQHELPLFGEKRVFPCLEKLRLSSINVERIWHHQLPNKSFCTHENLTSLIVDGCGNLKHLLSSSMARNLVNLKDFEIVECKYLREIIFSEEDDIEEQVVLFPQLNSLKIKNLQNLRGFCSEDYNIVFPSLTLVAIEHCPTLWGFIYKSTMEDNQHLSSQALFDKRVAFPSLQKLRIVHLKNVKMIWHNQLSVNSICKLTEMSVEHCYELVSIFPGGDMWSTFQNLETLRVSSCGSLEEIFEVQSLNMEETYVDVVATGLRELYIKDLSKLKHVWSKDPQGILTFPNLRVVHVWGCWSLTKNVFPASIARDLAQLKDLNIQRCGVEEIVSKEEGTEASITFEFNQLSSFKLWNLPNLKCFYPGMHVTKWPMSKRLVAYHCHKVKIFDTDMNENDDGQQDPPTQRQPSLFLFEKVVTRLEEVRLNGDDITFLSYNNKLSRDLFRGIKALTVCCYHDDSAVFPITFLERFNDLEVLEVHCCSFKELFSCEDATVLVSIKKLRLNFLNNLKRMWKQESQLDNVLTPNLETLEVHSCRTLISLGLSLAPFQNLMTLDVWRCKAMINLVTSSATIQSLVQIKTLKIRECESIKEVVGDKGGEATDDIVFNRLKSLELRKLRSLKSFCSGNHIFSFPSLEQVIVIQCPELEIFYKGVLNVPTLRSVQATVEDKKGHWGGDLNSTVTQLYTKKVAYQGVEHLILSDSSCSIDIWKQNLQETLDFRNLKVLEVKDCSSLTYIFTISMAMSLLQLNEIKVNNCPMMEQITTNEGAEEATISTIMLPRLEYISLESCSNLTSFFLGKSTLECPYLKEMTIVDCPKMFKFTSTFPRKLDMERIGEVNAHFFNDKMVFPCLEKLRLSSINAERIWHHQLSSKSLCSTHENLTSLIIKGCANLKHLLSSSMAKSLQNLKYFEIAECKYLREIIFSEEDDIEEQVVLFPQLNSLKIKNLQNLRGFCSEDYNIVFPSLTLLAIELCPTLWGFIYKSTMEDNQHLSSQALFDERVAFPSLQKLRIVHLRNVKMIWHNQLSVNSICKLTDMTVEHCYELVSIFPGGDMRSTFQNLETLRVSSCGSLEEIFEIQSLNMEETYVDVVATGLRELYIKDLPKLKHVWSKDPQGLLTFPNLRVVHVWGCWSLTKNVFPASIARDLAQLKDLNIQRCGVEEIVSKEEGSEITSITFKFDQLSSLTLWNLPNLKCFYPGMHVTKWPMLEKLKAYHCNKVKVFDTEIKEDDGQHDPPTQRQPPLFLVEKVVTRLEEVRLNGDDITFLSDNNKLSRDLFRGIKALTVCCYHDDSAVFPITFLERFNDLEVLEVNCCSFKELFSCEEATALVSIKKLRLKFLNNLNRIWKQESQLDNVPIPNLETLEVHSCSTLISLGSFYAPFQNLMTLDVWRCKAMIYLVTSSAAAQSLVQLKTLRVRVCESMKEVVGNKGGEAKDDIIFSRLKCLELWDLPSLKSFCSSNHSFSFPSLEDVKVIRCPKLEIFGKGVLNVPMLRSVHATVEEKKGHWGGDLNSTVKQLYTKEVRYQGDQEYLILSDHSSKSIDIWKGNLQESLDHFTNLKVLEVKDCSSLTYIFTTSMALSLVQLNEIKVNNCPGMKQIIRNEGAEEATVSQFMLRMLRSITLESCSSLTSFSLGSNTLECPSLEKISIVDCPKMFELASPFPRKQDMEGIGKVNASFFNDKVPSPLVSIYVALNDHGVILSEEKKARGSSQCQVLCPKLWYLKLSSLNIEKIWPDQSQVTSYNVQNLTNFVVKGCHSLKYISSSSLCEKLTQLARLWISDCTNVEEVICTERLMTETQTQLIEAKSTTKFVFPHIIEIVLKKLPKLKCFYSKIHTTEWPLLRRLAVIGCNKVKTFAGDIMERRGESQLEIFQQPLFWVNEDPFPNLERLYLKENHGITEEICHGQLPTKYFPKLSWLKLGGFPKNAVSLPSCFIQSLPNLKKLKVSKSSLHEVFECEGLSRLKKLKLSKLPELTHLWKEGIPPVEVFNNLITLKVIGCGKLENVLVPSSVAFKNLTTLAVSECHGLKNLVTFPTARSMMLLETLSVTDCQMMKEIIASTTDDEVMDGIIFFQLKSLELGSLPSLSTFCSGNYTFGFPSLEKLIMKECPKMESFSEGELSTPMLRGVQSTEGEYVGCWEGDLNAIIRQLFVEKVFPSMDDLEQSSINIQRLWLWKLLEASSCAQNLTCLTVVGCPNLKCLFSTSMVRSFVQLKILHIDNCENVETIIFMEGSGEAELMSQTSFRLLDSLLLKDLPKLTRFCHGSYIEFPLLRFIRIESCPTLKTFISDSVMGIGTQINQEAEGNNLEIASPALFNEKVAFLCLEEVSITCVGKWRKIWHDYQPTNSVRIHFVN